jgi:AAA+ ATPase superfamily predicted ATPase
LLREVCGEREIYYLADTRQTPLQIQTLAEQVARTIPGFDGANYPSWHALFQALAHQAPAGGCNVILDEFPHLAQLDPSLPGTLQKLVDDGLRFGLVLCGSSQRMMQGLVLDASAPLYGRAREILKIVPLPPAWLREGLGVDGAEAVESFAVWGGVPRYWELAREATSLDEAIRTHVLSRHGVLHNEPQRLLLDDMRSASQAHSLLALIAGGCHRLSEIAGRLSKPANSLSRSLEQLIDLGYVRREIPFGESLRSTRRTLYRLDDPFVTFWHRFVLPHRSMLELDRLEPVWTLVRGGFAAYVAGVWEQLCRQSVAYAPIGGIEWKPGARWWGTGVDGTPCEIDVATESVDGRHLLLGEVKWERATDLAAIEARLRRLGGLLPFTAGRTVHYAAWVREAETNSSGTLTVRTPAQVIGAMR